MSTEISYETNLIKNLVWTLDKVDELQSNFEYKKTYSQIVAYMHLSIAFKSQSYIRPFQLLIERYEEKTDVKDLAELISDLYMRLDREHQ